MAKICTGRESKVIYVCITTKKAKKLSFDIIPRYVDDYIAYARQYVAADTEEKRLENPIHHIANQLNEIDMIANSDISYSLILNLVSACGSNDSDVIWKYIEKFSHSDLKKCDFLLQMVQGVIHYYNDFVVLIRGIFTQLKLKEI